MVLVNCFVHGDIDEAGTMCSFHAPVPLNFFQLNEYFPFAGNFHFRLKTPGASVGLTGIDYVWFDILKNDEPLPIPPSNDVVEIRALVLDLPNEYTNDDDYADYLEEINQGLGVNPHERPNRSFAETKKTGRGLLQKISQGVSKTKSAAKTINMQSVAKGATSLWNTVKATASHIQQSIAVKTSMLSDASEENLANLSEDLASVFSESRHSNLLKELWRVMFPDRQFERNSLIWREAGWQQQDPVTDLKASGILAVRTMTFMCRTFPERSQDMLTRNKANIKANYPFAIVGINLTLLLADLIGLKDQKYEIFL